MVLSSILYAFGVAFLVATLDLGLRDGEEHRGGTRALVAALLCLACMLASWQIMYGVAPDVPACETSVEVTD